MANYDWRVSVPASGEQRGHTFFVAVRPHTAMFLRAVSKWYEVVVFTASMQVLQSESCAPCKDRGRWVMTLSQRGVVTEGGVRSASEGGAWRPSSRALPSPRCCPACG